MPGMAFRAEDGRRWRIAGGYAAVHMKEANTSVEVLFGIDLVRCMPDLTDPATMGCLLALVREAWDELEATPAKLHRRGRWVWVMVNHDEDEMGTPQPTEVAALVAALEAAGGEALVSALEAAP